MMINRFKEEFNQTPARCIFGIIFLFLVGIVCVYQISCYITILWPDERVIDKARTSLVNSQFELLKALNEKFKLMRHRKSLKFNSKCYWLKQSDGASEPDIKEVVDNAAESAGFVFSSVGAMRVTKITDGIALVGLSVRGKAPFKVIVDFISEIEKAEPAVYWKSLLLRPSNQKQSGDLLLNGHIQVVVLSGPEMLQLFSGVE